MYFPPHIFAQEVDKEVDEEDAKMTSRYTAPSQT